MCVSIRVGVFVLVIRCVGMLLCVCVRASMPGYISNRHQRVGVLHGTGMS